MPNPVVHFEIQSSNDKELQKYYADLFDWHVNADNPMGYGVVDTHTEGGIGGGIGGKQGGPNQVLWYVQVDDPDAYLKKAESLGGKTVMPVTEIPGMSSHRRTAQEAIHHHVQLLTDTEATSSGLSKTKARADKETPHLIPLR